MIKLKKTLFSHLTRIATTAVLGCLSVPAIAQQVVWTNHDNMNGAIFEATAFQYNDDLYVFNGFVQGNQASTLVEQLDADSLTWSVIGNANVNQGTARTHNGLVRVGNEVWSIGGRLRDSRGPVTDTVWIYNLANNTWSQGPKMPVAVGAGGAVLVNNKIHWIGGFDSNASCDVNHHFIYDLNNTAAGWQDITSVAPMPSPRNHFATTLFNGEIYTIGGQFGHGGCPIGPNAVDTNLVYSFNPANNVWTQRASLPAVQSHTESSTFVYQGAIYMVGGESQRTSIYRYDPRIDLWETMPPLPVSLVAPVARVIDNRLYVASGGLPDFRTPTNTTRSTDIGPYLLQGSNSNGTNLALNGTASQSSTTHGGNASRAIDGNTSGVWGQGSVTHTANSNQPWWQVQLASTSNIDEIALFNRTNCCSNRLSNYTVSVLNDNGSTVYSRVFTETPSPSNIINLSGVVGRTVRVQLNGRNPLSLAEVQVMGTPRSNNDISNLALGGSATQSSTTHGGNASRAIDGNTNGAWNQGSVTHTANSNRPSWQVELAANSTIDEIVLFNRTDCCTSRLSNYTVSILDNFGNTVFSRVFAGSPSPRNAINAGGTVGRTIRVQLNGTNPLSLAEVQVMGSPR